jgi:hypothetical protein
MISDQPNLHDQHPAHVAASYANYRLAETAVRRLLERGIPAEHVSLVGKPTMGAAGSMGFTTIANAATQGSKFGAVWGGAIGLLLGFTLYFEPDAGPLLWFGPLAYALTSALEGAVVGGLAAILLRWGLGHERAQAFQSAVTEGRYLVVVSGGDEYVNRAYFVLQAAGATDVEIFPENSDNSAQ